MDVLMLSRLQFAAATFFHFLFVPLTLGLSILIAIMETIYVRTGDEDYRRMAKFWGKIFLVNFAVGVVTGITLEFQFGTNWSRYSRYVGDVFGSLLAIEATAGVFPGVHVSSRSGPSVGIASPPASTPSASGWWLSPPIFRPYGFSSPTPGCNIRWAMSCATAGPKCMTFWPWSPRDLPFSNFCIP